MSYNLFLLLNVNHEKDRLFEFIGEKLERTGPESFCLDESPDVFFSVEYLQEGNDTSLVVDIPFGGEDTGMRQVLDFLTSLEDYMQFQLLDPQLGRIVKSGDAAQMYEKYRQSNLEALENFADGHHFLRIMEERDGKKIMVEAVRFKEENWQNYCSVAMAYGRIQNAEKARIGFEKALELDPENGAIQHALGVTYFNLKDYGKASDLLSVAVQSDPENLQARELLEECKSNLKPE